MLFDPKWEEKVEVKLEPWQEILLKAADLIEQRGWTKDRFENVDGNLCMIGAMRVAVFGKVAWNHSISTRDLTMAHNKLDKFLGRSAARWNDRSAGYKEEVIAKLREVATTA